MAGKLSGENKMILKFGNIIIILLLVAALACNNDATEQDKPDSATHTGDDTTQHNWPHPRDIMSGDSIPSPETHADTSGTTLKK